MKILSIKLLLLLIGLGVIAPMFIRGLDGEPIMTLDDWLPHSLIRWSENTIDGLGSWGDALSSETPLIHHSPPAVIGAGAEIYTSVRKTIHKSGVRSSGDASWLEIAVFFIPNRK